MGESSDDSPKPNVCVKNKDNKTDTNKKETSRHSTKEDNTESKDSSEIKKEQKPTVDNNSTKTAEKVKDNPIVPAVSHDEGCRTRTRSSQNNDPATNNDQTEKGRHYLCTFK